MPVSIKSVIESPIHAVWEIISDFANLKRWHPLVVRCEPTGAGEGAVRTVYFADWWATEELVLLDADRHVLAYLVTASDRAPVIGARGEISLRSTGDAQTEISWVSGLPPENPFAKDVNASLEAYYPARISHLKAALGLQV